MKVLPIHEHRTVYVDAEDQPGTIRYWWVDDKDIVWRCSDNLSQSPTSLTGTEMWDMVVKGVVLAVLPPHQVDNPWKKMIGT